MAPKVVVTGLGIISPIGIGVSNFWKAALEGRQGISAIKSFGDLPIEQYRSRVAGQIHRSRGGHGWGWNGRDDDG